MLFSSFKNRQAMPRFSKPSMTALDPFIQIHFGLDHGVTYFAAAMAKLDSFQIWETSLRQEARKRFEASHTEKLAY